MNRRKALGVIAGTAATAIFGGRLNVLGQSSTQRSQMGMVAYALGIHRRNNWAGRHKGLSPALALLEESYRLGAGGIQVDLKDSDAPHLNELRQRANRYGMHMEALIQSPKSETDVERFEQAIRYAKQAGMRIARTVIIPGRRYERFQTLEEFREFEKRGELSLQWVEPILKRHRFRLAIENHKDQRTWERLALLERISSEYIGMCVDVGNSFALMEDALEAVRLFAPWAFTVQIKDQAIREHEEGFWLADVPLGDGFLKLPAMVKVLQKANPSIHFYYESITRDPISLPIHTDGFWSTMADTPATELVRTLRILKNQSYPVPFPLVTQLSPDEQMALENEGVVRSLKYAVEVLGL